MEARMDNKNTLKKTAFDLRIVRAYLCRVKEERELLSIPVPELDAHLANFLRSHRKQDGSEYEAGTLRGILGSLDRHFEKSNYPYAIYRSKDTRFSQTVRTMKEKQRYLKTLTRGRPPSPQTTRPAEALTQRDVEMLYASGTIGLHGPAALLQMLFFNIGLHFSLRSAEQHALKWGDILLKADSRGRKYLEHIKKLSLGRGHPHPSQTMRMQIYESPEQPERDVVRAYEKYAVERPEKMKHRDAPFYLAPQQDCRPGYARWFKNLPMGEARIRGIMKSLKVAASLANVKKVSDHCTAKVFSIRGNPGTLRVKTARESTAENGNCKDPTGVHPQIKPDVDSFCREGTKPHYSDGSIRKSSRLLSSRISNFQPNYNVGSRRRKKIKEEWDVEPNVTTEEAHTGATSFYGGQVSQSSVTFHDVAACFSVEEWGSLEEWQKELYRNVMREIHAALRALGYAIMNSDVLLKIKEDAGRGHSEKDKSEPDSARRGPVTPDLQLRIKSDHVPEWKDTEAPEKGEELDASNSSLPVFDPDLSLWIFREEPNASSPEATEDRVPPPGDTEAASHHVPPSPPPYMDPVSDPAVTNTLANPGVSRPGKRKRRPPQRRSSEQRRHFEEEEQVDFQAEPQHRLPYLSQTSDCQMDWLLPGRLYQCDLCDRSFSDRSVQFKTTNTGMVLSCPQCGGTLNLHPLYNRPPCAEYESSCAETVRLNDHMGDSGFPHPMQGSVG